MIEYILQHLWQIWAIVAALCLILELSSGDFFIICFSIGAVAALIASLTGLGIYWQMALFVVFSLIAIYSVRPFALRWLHKGEPNRKSNAEALIGRQGRVTEDIRPTANGYVQVDGDLWRAVSADGTLITAGQNVRIVAQNSTIVTVEKL
jgi:membrane protein implicated in regulation of membrane protease activity